VLGVEDASLLTLGTLRLVVISSLNDLLSVLIKYLEQSVAVCRRLTSHLTSRLQTCFTVHVQIWQTTSSVTYCSVGRVLTLPELIAYACCNNEPLTGLFTYSYLLSRDCTFAGSNNVCTLVFGLWGGGNHSNHMYHKDKKDLMWVP